VQDEQKLTPLLAELSPEAAAGAVARMASVLYVQKGPGQARSWAESLPSGAIREAAWRQIGAFSP
jgi:hypothetical protein